VVERISKDCRWFAAHAAGQSGCTVPGRLGRGARGRGRQNLLEIIDVRVPGKSVLITSQLPTKSWNDYLGEPTSADAILDRLLHNKHAVELKGDSLRRGMKVAASRDHDSRSRRKSRDRAF